MTIKDYKTFLNSLPSEFDEYQMVHREYTDISDGKLNAQEVPVYSVHIDEFTKLCCNMHKESYKLYNEFVTLNDEVKTMCECGGATKCECN
jgi:hypothetical protein|tara:strand:- start:523 stop:795 length:273 start_codon:yes stop_codon:yes gene_type:complete